jgi:hypothetical protein
MDANLKLGLQFLEGHWLPTPSRQVGAKEPQKETHPASKTLREFLEHHDIALINTFFEAGRTFCGPTSQSRIDYIGIPTTQLKNTANCGTLTKASARLQRINTKRVT